MDFALTEEQQLLSDSLTRFLDQHYTMNARREAMRAAPGYDAKTWRGLAQLGVFGAALPSEYGGFDGNGIDTMVVMQARGRALALEPYLASAVLGGGLLDLLGSAAQKQAWLPRIVSGESMFAFAHSEREARYALPYLQTQARRSGDGFILNGDKAVVLHGGQATQLVVSARTSGAADDASGHSLFLLDAQAAGLSVRDYATIDGLRAAELRLRDVQVPATELLGQIDQAYPAIEAVIDRGIAALCAEALGAMQALFDATLAYLKTRQQFGVPIGAFQVLQHRMADMLIHLEQARSMTYLAAAHAHEAERAVRRRAISAAKVQVGDAARYIAQQSVQLHGGMGMTDELIVGHYVKRLTMINATFGNVDTHLEQFAAASPV